MARWSDGRIYYLCDASPIAIKSFSIFFFAKKHNKICQSAARAIKLKFLKHFFFFVYIFFCSIRIRSIEFDKHSNITSAGRSDISRCHSVCHRLYCIGNGVSEAGQQVCVHLVCFMSILISKWKFKLSVVCLLSSVFCHFSFLHSNFPS